MTVNTTPQFTIAEAAHFAREFFGIVATASPLPSERDQNFALRTASGERLVLKIAKSDEELSVLELQNAVLSYAAPRAPSLALPSLIATPAGEELVAIKSACGQSYFLRLMSWLDGEILVHAQPHGEALLRSLGAAVADLDLALLDFSHPAMRRVLNWDLKRADLALEHIALLSRERQTIVRRFMDDLNGVEWSHMRHSLIHGDANDYNVLVRGGLVVGLLDFGDIVHSAVACDLAVALAYALLDKPDPLTAGTRIIGAYHARFPLTDSEVAALYPLMTARLCMSLCYAAYNAQVKKGDAYQLVTAEPAWTLIQQLAELPKKAAQSAFQRACEAS